MAVPFNSSAMTGRATEMEVPSRATTSDKAARAEKARENLRPGLKGGGPVLSESADPGRQGPIVLLR